MQVLFLRIFWDKLGQVLGIPTVLSAMAKGTSSGEPAIEPILGGNQETAFGPL
jgi:hypothetical protein